MADTAPFVPLTTNKESFNPDYIGSDGKIDKAKLFAYILPGDKRMALAQLRQVVMKVANVQSFNFAFRLIEEAVAQNVLQQIEIDGQTQYLLGGQTRCF